MNDENLIFLSASDYGTYRHAFLGSRLFGAPFANAGSLQFIPTDFVGMNTNIYEPLTSSTNMLGYGDGGLTGLDPGGTITSWRYQGGLDHVSLTTIFGPAGALLNGIILHRQGPYGWPSWKQVRVGNHPVNRAHRKNNIFSYAEKSSTGITSWEYTGGTRENIPSNTKLSEALVAFNLTESCVTSKHKPLQHSFVVEQDGKLTNLNLKHSYGNLEEHYTNEKINIRLKFNGDFPYTFTKIYDDLKQIYIDKDFVFDLEQQPDDVKEANPYGMATPFKKWVNMTYAEGVFPKQQNAFLAKTRQRTKYAEVPGTGSNGIDRNESDIRIFWKDTLADRNSLRVGGINAGIALNSLNEVVKSTRQSVWPLDNAETNGGNDQGEFGYPSLADSTVLWAGSGSVGPYYSYGGPYGLYPIPLYKTDVLSGKKPFFNSYEDFAEDIRGLGKDYSILPEFRISDHIPFYVEEKEGNFLAHNPSFLDLNGAAITSSAAIEDSLTGLNNDFFVEYSHSDFLKYFHKLNHDHEEIGLVEGYTFTMKGIKKLLPYKGFYPILRVQQLVTLFSQSFGQADSLGGSSFTPLSAQGLTSPHAQRFNSFVQPFFAPGITFNTIKSAIAVDFPVYVDVPASSSGILGDSLPYYFTSAPSYRFPFEAIIQPELYIPKTPSKTADPVGAYEQRKIYWQQNYIMFDNPYAVWFGNYTQLYSLAANNFYGEIPRFFLKDQKFTDFTSRPQKDWGQVEVGKTYYLDGVVKRSEDMILSEGQKYSGSASPYEAPPNRGGLYGPSLSSSYAGVAYSFGGRDPAYAAYTPPYFYDDCIARIAYTPTASGQLVLNDLLSSVQIELETSDTAPQNGLIFTGSFEGLFRSDIASQNKMQVTASVNLFGKASYPKVTFDENGNPLVMEQTDSPGFKAWTIGTKFECPALNFSASTDYHTPGHRTIDGKYAARGIFGGYGTIPSSSAGVYLQLKESFPRQNNAGSLTTGSLIDICGFKARQKKVGQVAQSKVISEAVVAIPFTYESHKAGNATTINYPNTVKKFFGIGANTYKSALKQIKQGAEPGDVVVGESTAVSVADMITKMPKYNIPPQFDFLTFSQLKPFVMYIFEFEHSLTQQDLVDIWQGLMPQISTRAEQEEVIITHKSGPHEFFKGKKLPKTTRWMLFKVKKKAEKSYFAVTSDMEDDSRFKFQFGNQEKAPEYSYNWPYDFFSLVELAKMEVDIEFTPKTIAVQTGFVIAGEGE